jgi:hypothetical protein
MGMRFIHFSGEPLSCVYAKIQDRTDNGGAKPTGLWFTVGNEGAECWRSISSPENLRYATELVLDESRFLQLSNASEILAMARRFDSGLSPHGRGTLDWKAIAAQSDGIIVAPFCNDPRVLQRSCWYHEWDCASGCVWNARSVAGFKALP